MRCVLGIASHHALAGARRKATSGLHDRRSSSLSRMAYMLLDSVRRELLGESPISNSEECGAHSPDRSLCSMKLRLRFFLRAKSANSLGNGAPGRTRTCDPRLRRAVVLLRSRFVLSDLGRYPRELPTRSVCDVGVRCEARPHLRGKRQRGTHEVVRQDRIEISPP